MKIAILDDWLDCALNSCDWNRLGSDVTIDVFHDTIAPPPPCREVTTL